MPFGEEPYISPVSWGCGVCGTEAGVLGRIKNRVLPAAWECDSN